MSIRARVSRFIAGNPAPVSMHQVFPRCSACSRASWPVNTRSIPVTSLPGGPGGVTVQLQAAVSSVQSSSEFLPSLLRYRTSLVCRPGPHGNAIYIVPNDQFLKPPPRSDIIA